VDEPRKASLAEEVELDIRRVERGERLLTRRQGPSDCRNGRWAGEIAYNRNYEIAGLKRFQELEVVLRDQEAAALARAIFLEREIAIGRVIPLRRATGTVELEAESVPDELLMKAIDRRLVGGRERNAE